MGDGAALREARRFIRDVGVHRFVPVRVDRVDEFASDRRSRSEVQELGARACAPDESDAAVAIWVTRSYRAAEPVCCSMPWCYMPFLRPEGLREIGEEYRSARKRLLAPEVTITVRPVFEERYRFLEPLYRPRSEPQTYRSMP